MKAIHGLAHRWPHRTLFKTTKPLPLPLTVVFFTKPSGCFASMETTRPRFVHKAKTVD